MGVVQDMCWKWCEIGDQYLGRVMAGLDPNSPDFGALPPHFIRGFEDPFVKEAFDLSFSNCKRIMGEVDMKKIWFFTQMFSLCSFSFRQFERSS